MIINRLHSMEEQFVLMHRNLYECVTTEPTLKMPTEMIEMIKKLEKIFREPQTKYMPRFPNSGK